MRAYAVRAYSTSSAMAASIRRSAALRYTRDRVLPALNSATIQKAVLDILLTYGRLYEDLRGEAA